MAEGSNPDIMLPINPAAVGAPVRMVERVHSVNEKKSNSPATAIAVKTSGKETGVNGEISAVQTSDLKNEQTQADSAGTQEDSIPLLDELPLSVRAAIPDLRFAGHVYSDQPQKRMIIINSRVVREGDRVDNGLTLERITNRGVVMRFKRSLFQVKLF